MSTNPAPFPPHAARPGLVTADPTRDSDRVLVGLLVGGALLVAGWGVHQLTQHALPGSAGRYDAGARLCGLVAGYLSAAQVLLAARLPWVEHAVPVHRIRTIHLGCGLAFLTLTTAHAALAIAANGASVGTSFASALVGVTFGLPYVWLAMIGLALLLVAGISSIPVVRRAMPYGWWHLLHLVVYPAIAVSFAHELLGADLTTTPARVLWTGLHLVALAAVCWYRILTPAWLTLRHQLTVEAVERESPDVVSILVSGHALGAVGAQPGQYFRLRALRGPMWRHSHPFSLSAAPSGDRLRFTVKAVGDYSNAMARLEPGRWLLASGPYGALTARARTRRRVLLIAGGMGIAPLRALLEGLEAAQDELTLLYRTERADQVIFREEIDELALRRGATVHYLTGASPPGTGTDVDPLSPRRLVALVPHLVDHDVYVCGPRGMVTAVTRALRAAGLDSRRIHTETSAR
ncbi:Predicted ferric reductase [Frankia canadensis]|uniref:Predicted ferric reductase n=1 Tax=Frankia canadensis TaxID=1836972 RepID=A0A2I2KL24_9ACTN|nr:ferredoxin reductase family protein [Frankia canadensis]SNQ46337.1 Predicted ferric reductase [Frankia canadensis]SOU53627.1 Predicted ferric reductase [Frankia canadensis]